MDLWYQQQNYDKQFSDHVYSCPLLTFEEVRRGLVKTKGPVRIQYNTKDQYKRTAKLLGLMDDFKVSIFFMTPSLNAHLISYRNQPFNFLSKSTVEFI